MTRAPKSAYSLPRWHARGIYAGFALLLGSGIVWLLLHHYVEVAGPFGPAPHPAEALMIKLHGIVAYGFVLLAGALIPMHLRLGWAGKRNRGTGVLLGGALLLIALTGLALYYAGSDDLRGIASLVHWLVGLLAALVLVIHAVRGRRLLPRSMAPVHRAPQRKDPA